MEYILIILIELIILFYIYFVGLEKLNIIKEKSEIITILNKYGHYYQENSLYDYNNDMYKVVFLVIKQDEELVINNPYMFEKFYKTKSTLIDMNYLNDELFKTLVIVYPSNAPIKRFINENELVFVGDKYKNAQYLLTQKYYLEQILENGLEL